MAPKKKKGSKSKTKTTSDPEHDELERKRRELIQTAIHLKDEIEKEKETKKEFEDKLEKLQFYWNLEKKEQKTKQVELEQRNDDLKDIATKHQFRVASIKEDLKHFLFEQQNKLITAKNNVETELYILQHQHSNNERKKELDTIECDYQLRTLQVSHGNFLLQLRYDHDEKVNFFQEEYKLKFHDITTDSDLKVKQIKEEMEIKTKNDLKILEEKKESQVNELLRKYEKEVEALRCKYNSKIHGDLDSISVFKNEALSKRRKLHQIEKKLSNLRIVNKGIVEPFCQVKDEVEGLKLQCNEFKAEKRIYNQRKCELRGAEDGLKEAQWKHEVLFQRYEILQREHDELRKDSEESLIQMKQKKNLDSLMFDRSREEFCNLLTTYRNDFDVLLGHDDDEDNHGCTKVVVNLQKNVDFDSIETLTNRVVQQLKQLVKLKVKEI